MKKVLKLISSAMLVILSIVIMVGCIDSAKKVEKINVENLFLNNDILEYEYGTLTSEILSNEIKVTVVYSDESTTILKSNEYIIEYYLDEEKIDKLNEILKVGNYSIKIIYKNDTNEYSKIYNFKIVNNEVLNVNGTYKKVNPIKDMELEQPPFYMICMNNWTQNEIKEIAQLYNANIKITYKDADSEYIINGDVSNEYTDTTTFNSFKTSTSISDGQDNYIISGTIDLSTNNSSYTVMKNNEITEYVINENIHQLTIMSMRIDVAILAISGENIEYFAYENSHFCKIKVLENSNGYIKTSYFVFNKQGNFIGQKVEIISTNDNSNYSIQMKLI